MRCTKAETIEEHETVVSDSSKAKGAEKHSKKGTKPKKRIKTLRTIVIAVLIGVAIGAFGMYKLQSTQSSANGQESTRWTPTASTVFEQVKAENELIGASQKYNIVLKAENDNKLFGIIDLPFTTNSFWYRYAGTLKAGVDLSRATYTQDGKTIHISLYEPYLSSNTPDMSQTGVLEERNNALNPIHVDDVDELQRQCREESESEYWNGDLISECKSNVEQNITAMFKAALGDEYAIDFQWLSDDAASSDEGQ